MTTQSPETPRLVYGHAHLHGCLAFADAATAADEAAEITAIASARAWGEVRSLRTAHVWNPFNSDEQDPADDAAFDISEQGVVQDGDWPPMVTSRAFRLLPQDLQDRFGASSATVLNGDLLEIPLTCEAELVAELRGRGYEVTRDDELINVLDGRGFSPLGG